MNIEKIHEALSNASKTVKIEPTKFFGRNVRRFSLPKEGSGHGFLGYEIRSSYVDICDPAFDVNLQITKAEETIKGGLADNCIEFELMRVYSETCGMLIETPNTQITTDVLDYVYNFHKDSLQDEELVLDLVSGLDVTNAVKGALGAFGSAKGWKLSSINFPNRLEKNKGRWVSFHPYENNEINRDYIDAPVSDSIVFLPNVIAVSDSIDEWGMLWEPSEDRKGGNWVFSCKYAKTVDRSDLGAVIRSARTATRELLDLDGAKEELSHQICKHNKKQLTTTSPLGYVFCKSVKLCLLDIELKSQVTDLVNSLTKDYKVLILRLLPTDTNNLYSHLVEVDLYK